LSDLRRVGRTAHEDIAVIIEAGEGSASMVSLPIESPEPNHEEARSSKLKAQAKLQTPSSNATVCAPGVWTVILGISFEL
jgi:hypothetical protein